MALLNKVIENKRDEYMISVLEEGTTELESLKTKKYLTENLHLIGKILMEEGVVDAAKANLSNNWGKYAAGAGALGAGALAYDNRDTIHDYLSGASANPTDYLNKGEVTPEGEVITQPVPINNQSDVVGTNGMSPDEAAKLRNIQAQQTLQTSGEVTTNVGSPDNVVSGTAMNTLNKVNPNVYPR